MAILDPSRAAAASEDSQAKVAALRIRIARLQAEMFGGSLRFDAKLQRAYPTFVRAQTNLYACRQVLQEGLASLESLGGALRAEQAMLKPLQQRGDASRSALLRVERELAQRR